MSLALAAVGAAVAALVQSTIVPFAAGGGTELDLVLVFAITWTMVAGLEGGLVWALVGGLIVDVLLNRPFGLTALVLTLAVGAAWLISLAAARAIYPGIVIAALLLAPAASILTVLGLRWLIPSAGGDPLSAAFTAAVANGVLAAIVGAAAVAIHRRVRPAPERVGW